MVLIFDTPEGIEYFAHCQAIACLRLEIRGIKVHPHLMAAVNKKYGFTTRTKKATLVALEELFEERYGRPYGSVKK